MEDFAEAVRVYMQDSRLFAEHLASRDSPVLAAKLSVVMNQFSLEYPNQVAAYYTGDDGYLVRYDATVRRGAPRFPGEDGPIVAFDGVTFFNPEATLSFQEPPIPLPTYLPPREWQGI